MKIPPCMGHAACSCGREGPGKCFAVRMGACKAKKIMKQKALAETSPPFLSQRLLGRCCRLCPCPEERPACPGEKRGTVLTPLLPAGTEPATRRAALLRANDTWLGAGVLGRWALRGSALPCPLTGLGRAPCPAGCTWAACGLAGLHLAATSGSEDAPGIRQGARALMPNPSTPTRFPSGTGEWRQTGWARGRGRRAGEGKEGGDAGEIGRGMPVLEWPFSTWLSSVTSSLLPPSHLPTAAPCEKQR